MAQSGSEDLMENCKDCKHWESPPSAGPGPYGICWYIGAPIEDIPEQSAKILGYDYADLYTLPTFGCVLFKSRRRDDD